MENCIKHGRAQEIAKVQHEEMEREKPHVSASDNEIVYCTKIEIAEIENPPTNEKKLQKRERKHLIEK